MQEFAISDGGELSLATLRQDWSPRDSRIPPSEPADRLPCSAAKPTYSTLSIERYLRLGEKNAHHAADCSAVRKPRNRLRLPSRFEATAFIPAAFAALRTS